MLRELFGSPELKSAASRQAPTTRTGSILDADTHVEGTLRSEGNVRIDGTFVGDITAQGKVHVGEQAKLEGDLTGETVAVAGMVRGDVTARKVSILRTGRVWGNLRLETLMTEEGGFIQGLITMEEAVELHQIVSQLDVASAPEATEDASQGKESPMDKGKVPSKTTRK